MNTDFHAIIVAAGSGARMQREVPKQYALLHNLSVLSYSITTFLGLENLLSLTVVIDEKHQGLFDEIYPAPEFNVIYGGSERHDSVYNALKALDGVEYDVPILIHDAARPFVSRDSISSIVDEVYKCGAASLGFSVSDSLCYENHKDERPSRDGLWGLQTPQGFKYGLIRHAHEKARSNLLGYDGVTDDTMLVEKEGAEVKLVKSSRLNFKITTKDDMYMAELLMQNNTVTKMATGFDVHAFEEYEVVGNQIKLGGISIPHKFELKGHSDADVVLHALTDALYGLISDGDIGSHFPPNDDANKNLDSSIFLLEAYKAVLELGGALNHVDLTVICEKPAIGPHRDKMRKKIADVLKVSMDTVSVKATTTEGLGFTGRREGIAVQAAVTAEFPRKDFK